MSDDVRMVETIAMEPVELRRGQKPGWVYFIACTETKRCKIGYTKGDPEKRLRSLQTGSAGELALIAMHPGTPETERSLHERFKNARKRGEWFEIDDDIRGYLCVVTWAMAKIYRDAGRELEPWIAVGLHTMANHADELPDEVLATLDMIDER